MISDPLLILHITFNALNTIMFVEYQTSVHSSYPVFRLWRSDENFAPLEA